MLLIILGLLVCQHMSASWSTRLPLEVYELTPVAASAAATTTAADGGSGQATHELNYLKHKSLEYATVHAKTLTVNAAGATTEAATIAAAAAATTTSDVANEADPTVIAANANAHSAQQQRQLDRRRSRQMLHILEQQQQHRYAHDGLHLQKLHTPQRQQLLKHAHVKDVRILYQVGESEDDLPICAANAVCSKIDLYETPWIERQCRCPELNRLPNIVIHHHHQSSSANTAHSADKYHSYLEQEKVLQHQRLLGSDYADNKIEKLMQKLGAVHEDDLQLYASDFVAHGADNEAVRSLEDLGKLSDNEFPHSPRRGAYTGAHMRHSGHMGHNKAKEISYTGGCPSSLGIEDGHTIADKTRHYKLCQPVHKLPVCKHFRDYTWTLTTAPELNVTEQIVHCRCPKNSVTYLTKREPAANGSNGYTYLFACSPLTRIRCQRKQPCKLFTVRKRQEFLDEVNINALCQCPKAHHCPSHHTQAGVITGESFLEDNIQTYSGYCMVND